MMNKKSVFGLSTEFILVTVLIIVVLIIVIVASGVIGDVGQDAIVKMKEMVGFV